MRAAIVTLIACSFLGMCAGSAVAHPEPPRPGLNEPGPGRQAFGLPSPPTHNTTALHSPDIGLPSDFRLGSGAGSPLFLAKRSVVRLLLSAEPRTGGDRSTASGQSPRNPDHGTQLPRVFVTNTETPFSALRTNGIYANIHDAAEKWKRWRTKKIVNNKPGGSPLHRIRYRWVKMQPEMALATCLLIFYMMPGRGGQGGPPRFEASSFNYRVPPSWGPERENDSPPYRFRAWATDVRLWCNLTDLEQHQQGAALVLRLTGQARESVRTLNQAQIERGGPVNGVHLDPVSFILSGLQNRYAQLSDETRLAAMVEYQAFARYPNEGINQVLDRFDIVRTRAESEGHYVQNVEACALQLLRCCHTNTQQLLTYTQPFGGRLPATEDEFREMQSHMRRLGHILEHAPNNLAQSLHGGRQARPGAYFGMDPSAAQGAFETNSFLANQFQTSPGYDQSGPLDDAFAYLGSTEYGVGGSMSAAAYPGFYDPNQYSYQVDADGNMDYDSETGTESSGTDTSSDDGNELLPEPAGNTQAEKETTAFAAYRQARRVWRRTTHRPVRKFRRTIKKLKRTTYRHSSSSKGKGKRGGSYGKSFGKQRRQKRFGRPFYYQGSFFNDDELLSFMKQRGKGGSGSKSSGKGGFGRTTTPTNGKGNSLSGCFRCGEQGHLIRDCPKPKGAGKGSSSGSGGTPTPTFMNQPAQWSIGNQMDTPSYPAYPAAVTGSYDPNQEIYGWGYAASTSYKTLMVTPPQQNEGASRGPLDDLLAIHDTPTRAPEGQELGADQEDGFGDYGYSFSGMVTQEDDRILQEGGEQGADQARRANAPGTMRPQRMDQPPGRQRRSQSWAPTLRGPPTNTGSDSLQRSDPWNQAIIEGRQPAPAQEQPQETRSDVGRLWGAFGNAIDRVGSAIRGGSRPRQSLLGAQFDTPLAEAWGDTLGAQHPARPQVEQIDRANTDAWVFGGDGTRDVPRDRVQDPFLRDLLRTAPTSSQQRPGLLGFRDVPMGHRGNGSVDRENAQPPPDVADAAFNNNFRLYGDPVPPADFLRQHVLDYQVEAQNWQQANPADLDTVPPDHQRGQRANWAMGNDLFANGTRYQGAAPPETSPVGSMPAADEGGSQDAGRRPAERDVADDFMNFGRIPTEPSMNRTGLQGDRLRYNEDTVETRIIMEIAELQHRRQAERDARRQRREGGAPHAGRFAMSDLDMRPDVDPENQQYSGAFNNEINPRDSVSQAGMDNMYNALGPNSGRTRENQERIEALMRRGGPTAVQARSTNAAPGDPYVVFVSTDDMAPLDREAIFGPNPPNQRSVDLPNIYNGRDTDCAICLESFANGQQLTRLQCRHAFHSLCYAQHAQRSSRTDCPNCRGAGVIVAYWLYVGDGPATEQLQLADRASVVTERPTPMHLPALLNADIGTPRSGGMSAAAPGRSPRVSVIHDNDGPSSSSAVRNAVGRMDSANRGTSADAQSAHGSRGISSEVFVVYPTTQQDAVEWKCDTYLGYGEVKAPPPIKVRGNPTSSYHAETQLPSGESALMLDIGSVGNLAGDIWLKKLTLKALKNGRRPNQVKRDRPLNVSGVGKLSQSCEYDCHMPVSIKVIGGECTKGIFKTPCVPDSELPALLGLQAIKQCRGIIDTNDGKFYMLGPGDYKLMDYLPPGTKCIQCIYSPSGHMMVPCDAFEDLDEQERHGGLEIQQLALPVQTTDNA